MADGIAYAVRPGGAFTDAIDATLSGGCETYLGAGCEPLWSAPITGGAALAASGPSLYATDASGIAAYATGPGVTRPDRQPAWTAAVSGAWAPALTPAADAITLLVGADDGLVRAHPADGCGAPTCTPSWTAVLGATSTPRSSPTASPTSPPRTATPTPSLPPDAAPPPAHPCGPARSPAPPSRSSSPAATSSSARPPARSPATPSRRADRSVPGPAPTPGLVL